MRASAIASIVQEHRRNDAQIDDDAALPRDRIRLCKQCGGQVFANGCSVCSSSAFNTLECQTSSRILAALAVRTRNGTGKGRIAPCVVALCAEIGAALTPIIGPRGVAALYKRSLFTTAQAHPALLGLQENVQAEMDLSPLATALAPLSDAEATLVGGALLIAFYELIASLIGPSLTERLLRSLWDRPLSDPPASEPPA